MLANSAFPAQTHRRESSWHNCTFADLNGHFYKTPRLVVGGATATGAMLTAALDAVALVETADIARGSLSDQWAQEDVMSKEAA